MEDELKVPVSAERGPFVMTKGLGLRTPAGPVYEDVSMEVEKGKVCCIFGEQGSGKTSLLLTLSGRMKAKSGRAVIGGYDLRDKFRLVRRMSGLAFIPGLNDVQSFLELKNITAAELSLAGKHGNKANTDQYLEDWGFADRAGVKFEDLDSYDTCLFGIILAMCGDPELLIVNDIQNELTQHQSIKIMGFLKEIARKRGTTVLVGCSEYEIARQADCVVVLGKDAETQRRAVIRALGVTSTQTCPVAGSGNHVDVDRDYNAASDSGNDSDATAPAQAAASDERRAR